MAAIAKLDWDQAFDEWILIERPKGEMTQAEFARSKGVAPTHLSRRFSEIEVERSTNKAKSKMAQVMVKSLDMVDESLDEMQADEKTSAFAKVTAATKSFTATSDRLGLSPQGATINIQNHALANAQSNFIIQPMFHMEQDQESFKQLISGVNE